MASSPSWHRRSSRVILALLKTRSGSADIAGIERNSNAIFARSFHTLLTAFRWWLRLGWDGAVKERDLMGGRGWKTLIPGHIGWRRHMVITSALYYVSLDYRPTQSTEIWTRPSSPLEIPDWVIAVHQKEWTGLDHRRPSSPSGSPPWPVKNTAYKSQEDTSEAHSP
jgi:hypothetical protein